MYRFLARRGLLPFFRAPGRSLPSHPAPTLLPPPPLPHSPTPPLQSYAYYHDWALKHILPPFVFACIAAALLLAFLLWRTIKLCTCVRCIRGPQRRARAAADTLAARRHRLLQAGVCLLACGVVAGAGYGLSTVQPGLQPRGVDVFEQAKVRARLLLQGAAAAGVLRWRIAAAGRVRRLPTPQCSAAPRCSHLRFTPPTLPSGLCG